MKTSIVHGLLLFTGAMIGVLILMFMFAYALLLAGWLPA